MAPRKIKNVQYNFEEQVVVVTGAARGQGRAHALNFAAAGADIVICDICEDLETIPYALGTQAELDEVARGVEAEGVSCLALRCDVRDPMQVTRLVEDTLERFEKIDVLICNAGTQSVFKAGEMTEQAWKEVVDSQLTGTFNCTNAVSPHMIERGRGKLLITGSTESFVALPHNTHYLAAKHGMLGLVRGLAVDLAPHGINVNMVCPGAINTRMATGVAESEAHAQWASELESLTGTWNLLAPGTLMEPDEISHAMMWLASDAAAFVTGTTLMVDAGFTIT